MSQVSPLLKIGLSCTTFPLLLGLGALPILTKALIELGQASEEVFRGDRLPVLSFPEVKESQDE